MTKILAYWPYLIVGYPILGIFLGLVNKNLPKDADGKVLPPQSWLSLILRAIVDTIALLPQPGKVGVLGPINLPLMGSQDPPAVPLGATTPPPKQSGKINVAVLFALGSAAVFAWALAGCATLKGAAIGTEQCVVGKLPAGGNDLLSAIVADIDKPADAWKQSATQLSISAGGSLMNCVMRAFYNQLTGQVPQTGQADPMLIARIQRVKAYLDANPGTK